MIEIEGFATQEECQTVIDAYERSRETCSAPIGHPFFEHRVLWINSFPDSENTTRRILQGWRRRAVAVMSEHARQRLYSDTIQVVRWNGQAMTPHQDDRHPDGAPHATPWRSWASIIYLNDNYDGGEIYFPDVGESYKPKAGALIYFRGDVRHGVQASVGGFRYTSPSWYSYHRQHEDRYASIDY